MKKFILLFSFGGLLFAGYLSGVKFFTKTCALGETCPIFLGQPACYFGFGMYLVLFLLSLWWVFGKTNSKLPKGGITAVSFLGILFAGYFTFLELPILYENGFGAFAMGLPTCAWGLLFYLAIFILSVNIRK